VTIEDSAELKLQQPHVVRLETRPANLEGEGEITIRDLVRNALRMRPDRIIVGECRGGEIVDMIQAMNTGHDGSMSTVHSNSPRNCLIRMENMLNMSGFDMPEKTTRLMVSSAVNLIVQVSRMRDGHRRVTHITEITGIEESNIVTQDLYSYHYKGTDENGKLIGEFVSTRITPAFVERANYYDLGDELRLAMQGNVL
jgi:pilus assembly protein CpaF